MTRTSDLEKKKPWEGDKGFKYIQKTKGERRNKGVFFSTPQVQSMNNKLNNNNRKNTLLHKR